MSGWIKIHVLRLVMIFNGIAVMSAG